MLDKVEKVLLRNMGLYERNHEVVNATYEELKSKYEYMTLEDVEYLHKLLSKAFMADM